MNTTWLLNKKLSRTEKMTMTCLESGQRWAAKLGRGSSCQGNPSSNDIYLEAVGKHDSLHHWNILFLWWILFPTEFYHQDLVHTAHRATGHKTNPGNKRAGGAKENHRVRNTQ